MTVEKPEPKQLLRPITTGTNSAMNQSEFLLITSNSLKGREKSRVHGAIGFGFASHWLKNWRESFKPITKRSNRNHVITFDSHLKTALTLVWLTCYHNCGHLEWRWNRYPAPSYEHCTDEAQKAETEVSAVEFIHSFTPTWTNVPMNI